MRICVTASGNSMESGLDERFGRCPYFVFADLATGEETIVLNESIFAGSGAGIFAGQLMEEKAADCVITGSLGPESLAFLKKAGIAAYRGTDASVRDNIRLFREGRLEKIGQPGPRGGHLMDGGEGGAKPENT